MLELDAPLQGPLGAPSSRALAPNVLELLEPESEPEPEVEERSRTCSRYNVASVISCSFLLLYR